MDNYGFSAFSLFKNLEKNNKKYFIQDISTAKIEIEESNNIDNN